MRVYVVSRLIDYEGGEVIGVYTTQEKAEQAVDNVYKQRSPGIHWDWDEWEVQ